MLLDSPRCEPGTQAPEFALKDFDGTPIGLSDALRPKGLLVMFICNHCPYVKAIADRLATDMKTLQDEGIGVVAIMSNDYRRVPADRPEAMREFAAKYGFKFPYLVDEDQSVGRAYGAVCTPDFFGFNGQGQLQYRGRLDDAKMGDASTRTPELVNAMRQIAETGQGPKEQTASIGCSIKWS